MASEFVASSWSTIARSAPATRAATSRVLARSDTVGNHTRRACLAASRAVVRHLSADFAARSPFHTATQREAAQGTTTATPTSVSTSTASSPRSPFGNAWTTTMLGTGSGWSRTADTTTSNELFEVAATVADGRASGAVGEHHGLAHPEPPHRHRVVRLGAGHGHGGPDRGLQGRDQVDRQGHQCGLNASRNRLKTDFCARTEPSGDSSPRSAASSRSSSS